MKNRLYIVCVIVFLMPYFSSLSFSADPKGKISQPVYSFEVRKDTLKMADGIKLAVTYFLPIPLENGETFPFLLNMDPYRKDDFFYQADYARASYFARRGFATARVDLRGTGGSEGSIPSKEYSIIELNDSVEIIDQLSKLQQSNGNVGMYGMSWSAFNSIMTAMRKPPALKAILAMHGSEDLFYNDIHFIDGVMHLDYYDQQIDTDNALPESNGYTTTGAFFENRFDREPWFIVEMKNQQDGAFWREESLLFHEPLEVPAYVIGGLLDGYRDFAPTIFETSKATVKMDIGPYNHTYPNNSPVGPRYEWREVATRWWDYWLKGIDSGILDDPLVTIYVRAGQEPSTALSDTPGSWRSETTWPIAGTTNKRYFPGRSHDLLNAVPDNVPSEIANVYSLVYSPGAGMVAGGWWGESVGDMAQEDAKSLVYDTQELTDDVEIIGFPQVSLSVRADAALYQWTVRLEDVSPDGKVFLVSGALINPTQRNDRLNPEAIIPGETMVLTSKIHFTTWTFKVGHRIRLAVANAQFPMAWPTPYKGSTQLIIGSDTWVELPVPPPPTLAAPVLPQPQEEEIPPDYKDVYYFKPTAGFERDKQKGISTFTTTSDYAWIIGEKDFASSEFYTWTVADADPARASFLGMRRDVFNIPGKNLVLYCLYDISSDSSDFRISITRTLLENGSLIRTKTWNDTVPRNHQ